MHESRPGGGGDRHVSVPEQVNVEWNGDFARQAVFKKVIISDEAESTFISRSRSFSWPNPLCARYFPEPAVNPMTM